MPEERVRLIEAVKTPIAFFVLVVLLVEGIFIVAAAKFPPQQASLIYAMIILIFLLVGIVAFLAYFRPEALRGMRCSDDPELSKIRQSFQEIEHLADKIGGKWTFVCSYRPEGEDSTMDVNGICEILKGKYGISISGNTVSPDGGTGIPFVVKQVFINEEGLTYIFEVPQDLGHAVLGVGQVRFSFAERGEQIRKMKGNWGVLGSKVSGKTEFNRE